MCLLQRQRIKIRWSVKRRIRAGFTSFIYDPTSSLGAIDSVDVDVCAKVQGEDLPNSSVRLRSHLLGSKMSVFHPPSPHAPLTRQQRANHHELEGMDKERSDGQDAVFGWRWGKGYQEVKG